MYLIPSHPLGPGVRHSKAVVVRPSGTEPKLKTYISVSAKTKEDAETVEKKITEELNEYFK